MDRWFTLFSGRGWANVLVLLALSLGLLTPFGATRPSLPLPGTPWTEMDSAPPTVPAKSTSSPTSHRWSMMDQGRAGYGATTEGLWSYSYDSCEPNCSGWIPPDARTGGNPGGLLSYLPGQRVSQCTVRDFCLGLTAVSDRSLFQCPGLDHPSPSVTARRNAPEIDILEAQIDPKSRRGQVSQSSQALRVPVQPKPSCHNHFRHLTQPNTYKGTVFQQAISLVLHRQQPLQQYNYGYEHWSNPSHRSDGIGALAILITSLLALFICYPVVTYCQQARNQPLAAAGNRRNDLSKDGIAKPREMVFKVPDLLTTILRWMLGPSGTERKGFEGVGCIPKSECINNHLGAYTSEPEVVYIATSLTWYQQIPVSQPGGGVPGGAGYPWPRDGLVGILRHFCTAPNAKLVTQHSGGC